MYYYTTPNDTNRAEYLLSSGIRKTEYNILNSGEEINKRYWDMYKDIKWDKDGYINNVHIMTFNHISFVFISFHYLILP